MGASWATGSHECVCGGDGGGSNSTTNTERQFSWLLSLIGFRSPVPTHG